MASPKEHQPAFTTASTWCVSSGLAGGVGGLPGHRVDLGGQVCDGEPARCWGRASSIGCLFCKRWMWTVGDLIGEPLLLDWSADSGRSTVPALHAALMG
jgi:hypothetical protein